eukprot:CAMPEP_0118972890 /NCGR_PEP_ID=MMETSP1173-20130426/9061_1 /TAXON_ID=1034831 /ORGANISM="Rhizochromulina marina cf, Strain CCMP1243" /LENGTH=61 /DNA_ID=CAMNT_0006922481 /DNA_START=197 /DNA_END=382 /DNA_ORIENTATION=-
MIKFHTRNVRTRAALEEKASYDAAVQTHPLTCTILLSVLPLAKASERARALQWAHVLLDAD